MVIAMQYGLDFGLELMSDILFFFDDGGGMA